MVSEGTCYPDLKQLYMAIVGSLSDSLYFLPHGDFLSLGGHLSRLGGAKSWALLDYFVAR